MRWGIFQRRLLDPMVYDVSVNSFGEEHIATRLARMGPWSVLKDVPWDRIESPRRVMEIVKDFERSNQSYIS